MAVFSEFIPNVLPDNFNDFCCAKTNDSFQKIQLFDEFASSDFDHVNFFDQEYQTLPAQVENLYNSSNCSAQSNFSISEASKTENLDLIRGIDNYSDNLNNVNIDVFDNDLQFDFVTTGAKNSSPNSLVPDSSNLENNFDLILKEFDIDKKYDDINENLRESSWNNGIIHNNNFKLNRSHDVNGVISSLTTEKEVREASYSSFSAFENEKNNVNFRNETSENLDFESFQSQANNIIPTSDRNFFNENIDNLLEIPNFETELSISSKINGTEKNISVPEYETGHHISNDNMAIQSMNFSDEIFPANRTLASSANNIASEFQFSNQNFNDNSIISFNNIADKFQLRNNNNKSYCSHTIPTCSQFPSQNFNNNTQTINNCHYFGINRNCNFNYFTFKQDFSANLEMGGLQSYIYPTSKFPTQNCSNFYSPPGSFEIVGNRFYNQTNRLFSFQIQNVSEYFPSFSFPKCYSEISPFCKYDFSNGQIFDLTVEKWKREQAIYRCYINQDRPYYDVSLNMGTFNENPSSNDISDSFGQIPGSPSDYDEAPCTPSSVNGSRRVDGKLCGVCGDKALGYNFNAITCESCKAFFRRNALKNKEYRCPFNEECDVTAVTRRFCQRCRLKKCLDIGMKKEWIMSDEDKVKKRLKIEKNRAKKRMRVENFEKSQTPNAVEEKSLGNVEKSDDKEGLNLQVSKSFKKFHSEEDLQYKNSKAIQDSGNFQEFDDNFNSVSSNSTRIEPDNNFNVVSSGSRIDEMTAFSIPSNEDLLVDPNLDTNNPTDLSDPANLKTFFPISSRNCDTSSNRSDNLRTSATKKDNFILQYPVALQCNFRSESPTVGQHESTYQLHNLNSSTQYESKLSPQNDLISSVHHNESNESISTSLNDSNLGFLPNFSTDASGRKRKPRAVVVGRVRNMEEKQRRKFLKTENNPENLVRDDRTRELLSSCFNSVGDKIANGKVVDNVSADDLTYNHRFSTAVSAVSEVPRPDFEMSHCKFDSAFENEIVSHYKDRYLNTDFLENSQKSSFENFVENRVIFDKLVDGRGDNSEKSVENRENGQDLSTKCSFFSNSLSTPRNFDKSEFFDLNEENLGLKYSAVQSSSKTPPHLACSNKEEIQKRSDQFQRRNVSRNSPIKNSDHKNNVANYSVATAEQRDNSNGKDFNSQEWNERPSGTSSSHKSSEELYSNMNFSSFSNVVRESSENANAEKLPINSQEIYLSCKFNSRVSTSRKDTSEENYKKVNLPEVNVTDSSCKTVINSILNTAITAEYNNPFYVPGGDFHCPDLAALEGLNCLEKERILELLEASKGLNSPLCEEPKYTGLTEFDPSLINVINLTEIAIRRIIKMAKKIEAFKSLCQEDHIALLKGGCTEMMILNSVAAFNADKEEFQIQRDHSKFENIKLTILEAAPGNVYEEHKKFLLSFMAEWRQDSKIIALLAAIALFTPERANVAHPEAVRYEQSCYLYLLKRYLECSYGACVGKTYYHDLLKLIGRLRILNEELVKIFQRVDPREVQPLLIEIFDLLESRKKSGEKGRKKKVDKEST